MARPGGTRLVKDVTPGQTASQPHNLTDVNGTLFFTAYEPDRPYRRLWNSDGTATAPCRWWARR